MTPDPKPDSKHTSAEGAFRKAVKLDPKDDDWQNDRFYRIRSHLTRVPVAFSIMTPLLVLYRASDRPWISFPPSGAT